MGIESRITSKGQATIPVEIRRKLSLQTGDRIAFIEFDQGFMIIPRNRPIESLFGSLADFAMPHTEIEDYDRAIGEAISDHVEGKSAGEKHRE